MGRHSADRLEERRSLCTSTSWNRCMYFVALKAKVDQPLIAGSCSSFMAQAPRIGAPTCGRLWGIRRAYQRVTKFASGVSNRGTSPFTVSHVSICSNGKRWATSPSVTRDLQYELCACVEMGCGICHNTGLSATCAGVQVLGLFGVTCLISA